MDTCAGRFLDYGLEDEAKCLIELCVKNSLWNMGEILGKLFEELYPYNKKILELYSICLCYNKNYEKSHNIIQKILKFPNLDRKYILNILNIDHFNYQHIQHKYSDYNQELVKKIVSSPKPLVNMFTFSITTCKRLDLFTKTMNSFIACCKDINLISEFICVDDNSSDEDRNKMKEFYPFFNFVFKNENNKGHPRSMNIIREMVKTPYLIHIEDDWEFFIPRNYLTDSLSILNSSSEICQCLFNRNYAEISEDVNIMGGNFKTTENSLYYFIHDNCSNEEFIKKYGLHRNCAYWPHFSFRPSVIKTSIFKELGKYSETAGHFEMEYAIRYKNSGKVSAFFPGINCIHIGRLTSERFDSKKENAYTLNEQSQFVKDTEITKDYTEKYMGKIQGLIVNLDNRTDRLENVLTQTKEFKHLKLERFSAINGFKLKPNSHLSRLFDGNDYNMRCGMVGCAMSHIKIMIDFLTTDKKYCLVLEDDINLVENFEEKLAEALYKAPKNLGLLYLGYHIRKQFITPLTFSNDFPTINSWDSNESLKQSLGGTFGYVITKNGCREILNFIDERGMTNGIDTIQQKAASVSKIFYCEPMLITSECCSFDKKVDSDIQYDFSSLQIPFETRIEQEYDFLKNLFEATVLTTKRKITEDLNSPIIYDSREEGLLSDFIEKIQVKFCYYIIDNLAVVVFPEKLKDKIYLERGISRLVWAKEDSWCGIYREIYCIDNCLQYKN